MKKIISIAMLTAVAAFAAACTNTGDANRNTTNTNATTTTNAAAPGSGATNTDAPANVRAAFPDAQSFTTQHKDLSASQIESIEKETGTKIADKDHHSYLAFSTAGGARRQIGAATVVSAGGKQMVVIYESREGVPYIKEVRAEGVAQAFLDGFKGKGHDDKFQVGGDIKANGVDEQTARAVAAAIRQDAMIMQTLYGGAHGH
ncbi:MAG: hypothetical protein H0T45_03910 [Pyrinomonadaceae bacterium]|nr:hypothetical protein [Pyrinomonadaceae bacterium]